MPTINTIDDVSNIRSIGTAVTANAGAIAIQNVNGSLKQVDDQGTVSNLGGGSGTITALTGDVTASGSGSVAATVANLPATVLATRVAALTSSTAGLLKTNASGTISDAVANGDYSPASWAQNRLIEIQTVAPTITRLFELNTNNISEDFETAIATTTGLAIPNPGLFNGGGFQVKTGTTAGGTQIGRTKDFAATHLPCYAKNWKSDPWAICVRINAQTAVDAAGNLVLVRAQSSATNEVIMGLVGSKSTTNFVVWNVAGNKVADTGQAVDTSGTTWHNCALVFDGTTLWMMYDGVKLATGVSDLTGMDTGWLTGYRFHCDNGATAANREYWVNQAAIFTTASP